MELDYWNEKEVLIILNKISKYWYKIAENTANIMFEDNSRKAVYAIAAVLENCNGMIIPMKHERFLLNWHMK